VGKTLVMQKALTCFTGHQLVPYSFSSFTSKQQVQESLDERLEKRRRNQLGGREGKQVIIFVDDVSMPAYDGFGTQPSIELMRQLVTCRGFYDQLHWKSVSDATLACVTAPPEGGRKVMSPRFTSCFAVLCMPPASEESFVRIFNTILQRYISHEKGFRKEVTQFTGKIVDAVLLLYEKVASGLKSTPLRAHYNFN